MSRKKTMFSTVREEKHTLSCSTIHGVENKSSTSTWSLRMRIISATKFLKTFSRKTCFNVHLISRSH